MKHLALLLAATTLSGCGDAFDPASRIERARVLGIRSDVHGDPGRAWPMPGETTDLSFLIAHPQGKAKALAWMFAACVSASGSAAAPICAEDPFATAIGSDVPEMSIAVPDEAVLGEASVLLVAGVVCAGGTPTMGADGVPGCTGDDVETTAVTASVIVQREAETNFNPDLTDDAVTIDEAPWPPSTPTHSLLPCSGKGLVELRERESVTLGLTVGPGDRDSGETLQISHFVTAGRLDRQFSIVEADDEEGAISVGWKAPGGVAPGGERVRVYLVARDGRGGIGWTSREVCVIPR